ncbi:flagellar biosynthesis anti-sigma factor FlgM [Novosphingopyxis sp.]|uniref:flagellar biosynthesis anti-sigma factor FlgM n=1 Tax=Novosphingopyxis sp. TaxID=2709690 RepID=UPI003B59D7A3
MKVDRPNGYSPVSTAALRSGSTQPVSAITETRAARDETAIRQSDAATIASEGAPFDQAKVDDIRAAIAEGRYLIDPQKLAQKMIALDLFGED